VFTGFRSPIDGGATSNLAADAAVGAVAEAGKRTGRVGDLGLGFAIVEAAVSGFLTGFSVEVLAGATGFEIGAVGGLGTPDGRLACFLTSLIMSFFGSLDGTAFGDAGLTGAGAFDSGCLPIAVALVGVRGAEVIVFCCLVSEVSGVVDVADAAAGWVSIGAGGAAFCFGSGGGFAAGTSFALPLVLLGIGALA
jgi:hypothetical protein